MSELNKEEKVYLNSIKLIKKYFDFFSICGCEDKWNDLIKENYNINRRQVFLLSGDYEYKLNIIENKNNAIFLRQSFLKSQKLKNEVLIPSSFGCVSGDENFSCCLITDKPKISFCGMKNTHSTREELLNILSKNEKIETNFIFTNSACSGIVDKDIIKKKKLFNENMQNSEFVFCPRGNGNFSIRFYETLKSGRIPIICDSDNELPFCEMINWEEICVITSKETIINDILNFHKSNDLIKIQIKCKEVYKKLFIDNFDIYLLNNILLCESKNNENIVSLIKENPLNNNIHFSIKGIMFSKWHESHYYNLDLTKKFYIARGGGQESALSFDKIINNSKKYSLNYFKNNPFFTNGCGIYFENEESINEYSKRYVNSYKKVHLYGSIPIENNPMQEQITEYLYKNGCDIMSHVSSIIEPFYYRYDNLDYLKKIFNNKKLLIISSHKKSFEHQIKNLKYINPIISNCDITILKPPLTNAGNHNNIDWKIHLNNFLDELKNYNNFDIAFVSAGGYDILISDFIYEKMNKSVIVIGGSLQLWFGVMGNRWKSWWNYHFDGSQQYWINTLDDDKPKNYMTVDNNGAYY